jgi:hypothetical protein
VARLLPPESAAVDVVAREIGVGAATLERWRSDALSMPARERAWTAAARFDAVLTMAAMDEDAKSAWCREHGVYPQELNVTGGESRSSNVSCVARTRHWPKPQLCWC